MAKTTVGAVVGRFQVPELTQGHRDLLNAVMERSDRLVILLGVSPLDGKVKENPLTFDQRTSLFRDYGHATILPVFDQPNDKLWSTALDRLLNDLFLGSEITLFGGRDSFTTSYMGQFGTEILSFHASATVQGTKMRNAIKESREPEFLRGQIYSLVNQYPKTFPTVDIVVIKDTELLLIQRADTSEWTLPGGFVDPTDRSLELAAKRELYEELGILSDENMVYVGSTVINDWRYRSCRDKIMTSLFVIEPTIESITPNPLEVQDYKWVKLLVALEVIAPHHIPLIRMLITRHLKLFVRENELDQTGKITSDTRILRG